MTKHILSTVQKTETTPVPLINDDLSFSLPPELEASEPPEAHHMRRDDVRLLVSYQADNRIVHTNFRQIGQFLHEGDLLVINTSGTLNAALPATRADGTQLELHLSTHISTDVWTVEVRTYQGKSSQPFYQLSAGEVLKLPGGATATLDAPYQQAVQVGKPTRLWLATLQVPDSLEHFLARYGFPIHYNYVPQVWPLAYYQTAYVTEMGSAEMPSAGRAFTPELITDLVAHGVQVAPLLLHTGVASLEEHEPPYEEYYRVAPTTAQMVNAAHERGSRVIAVGTTVVRALETVTGEDGVTHADEGWTSTIITPERGVHAVNGLLTGLHEPQATHLLMLAAIANREHLRIAYTEALAKRYLWHEFGDLHLLLP